MGDIDNGGMASADCVPSLPPWTMMNQSHFMLRDYFAAYAMIGIVMTMNSEARRRYRNGVAEGHEAQLAYALADAMLKARDAQND